MGNSLIAQTSRKSLETLDLSGPILEVFEGRSIQMATEDLPSITHTQLAIDGVRVAMGTMTTIHDADKLIAAILAAYPQAANQTASPEVAAYLKKLQLKMTSYPLVCSAEAAKMIPLNYPDWMPTEGQTWMILEMVRSNWERRICEAEAYVARRSNAMHREVFNNVVRADREKLRKIYGGRPGDNIFQKAINDYNRRKGKDYGTISN